MSKILYRGIMPALITPFAENGRILRTAVEQLMDYEYAQGVHGFYINGSTGEGPSLSLASRIEMSQTVCGYNKGRGVLIEHIGAPDFNDALALIKNANESGIDAISSLAPNFYYSFTDDEIVDYYKRIASVSDKPVLIYITNILKSDPVSLTKRLIEVPNIIGLKFTMPDYYLMRKLCEVNNEDINIINGADETLLPGLIMGAHGGIGSTYNIIPSWYVKLYESYVSGDIESARQLQFKCNRVIATLAKHSENGIVKSIKETLKLFGYDCGKAVYPSKTFTATEIKALKDDLESVGVVF